MHEPELLCLLHKSSVCLVYFGLISLPIGFFSYLIYSKMI